MRRIRPAPAGGLVVAAAIVGGVVAGRIPRRELRAVRASRSRVIAAADRERRRVVRDLHDGAQQRLVHTIVTLKLARGLLAADEPATTLVQEALDQTQRATDELRELAHGILPAVLVHGGLRAGVEALAARMPLNVAVDVAAARYPTQVEATAYFVVAEALGNVAEHAQAQNAWVTVGARADGLEVSVRDDGVGGALPRGPGLLGMADRLAAHDGRLHVTSPRGAGTIVDAWIPVAGSAARVAHVGEDGEDPPVLGRRLADT